MACPQCQRHLSEHLPRVALADESFVPVDHLHRLHSPFEHREQRRRFSLVDSVFAIGQADVRGHARDALAELAAERREQLETLDLLRGHH